MGTRHESEPRPTPRPTVEMSKDELLGLREACTDAKPNRTTNLGIQSIQWRRPATVVPRRPSAFLIVVALALAGLMSLVVALLVLR